MKFVLFATLLLTAPLLDCLAEDPTTKEHTTKELRVGVSIPLTGATAKFGQAVRNGIELARREHQKASLPIEFFYSDNRYDPKTAISGLQKLRAANSIDLLFVWGDAVSTAIAPIAERQRLPTIAVMTDPNPVQNMKNVIRFANSSEQYTASILSHLRKNGFKNIGMIVAQGPYYINMLNAMQGQLLPGENIEVVDTYRYDEHDFKITVSKLQTRNYEALGVFLMPGQVSSFFRQLQRSELNLPVFGSDTFASRAEAIAAQGAMAGGVYAYHDVDPAFRNKYRRSFGDDFQIMYAANAYEFARMLFALLQEDKKNAGNLLAAFRSIKSRPSVLGQIGYKENQREGGHFSFPIVIKTVPETSDQVRARAKLKH